jgi:hypothetical protein
MRLKFRLLGGGVIISKTSKSKCLSDSRYSIFARIAKSFLTLLLTITIESLTYTAIQKKPKKYLLYNVVFCKKGQY